MMPESIELITADTKFHAPYTHRVILLCLEKGIPYHITPIHLQNKPQWFLDIAPLGEVPVMRIHDQVIAGSFAIAQYLDPSLVLSAQDAETLRRIDQFGHELVLFCRQRKNTIADLAHLNTFLTTFNAQLAKRPYLSGDAATYLDFALIPHILQIDDFETLVFPFSMLAKHQNLSAWFERMMERPSVQTSSENHARYFIEHLQHRGLL